MLKTILRKEHKNDWEKRTPLTPNAIKTLKSNGYNVDVEESSIRIFSDDEYAAIPSALFQSPNEHQLVIGIKEPPIDSIREQQVHICFSHTTKGQDYNMPLLQRMLDKNITLLDYELITDQSDKRTIAFGRHAGIAGAIDTFAVLGQKYKKKSVTSALTEVKQTIHYKTIDTVKVALSKINMDSGQPIRVVIIGSGNVGKGSEEVCQWLGLKKLDAELFIANELPSDLLNKSWYVVLSSRHIHEKIAISQPQNSQSSSVPSSEFDTADFYTEGKKKYKSKIESLLGRFDVLIQAAYWTDFYPHHLTEEQFCRNADKLPEVIGDITCDIDGSFSCTKKISSIDEPAYSFNARTLEVHDGIVANELTVMAIDNLPCELSLDASEHFSSKLVNYTPHLMNMDLDVAFEDLQLIDELKKSVIVYRGELTEKFKYLEQFLS